MGHNDRNTSEMPLEWHFAAKLPENVKLLDGILLSGWESLNTACWGNFHDFVVSADFFLFFIFQNIFFKSSLRNTIRVENSLVCVEKVRGVGGIPEAFYRIHTS